MHRSWLSALFLLSLLLGTASGVLAQYSIPDCFVAAVNAIVPQQEYAASRDQYYRELSGEWLAATSGLSAQALAGYTQAFCNSLEVYDRGIDAEGERAIEWYYLPVETWLSGNGGSANTNTGSPGTVSTGNTTGSTIINSGSLTGTGSGATGGIQTGGSTTPVKGQGTTPATPVPVTPSTSLIQNDPVSGTIVVDTIFDRMPREWELIDADNHVFAGNIVNGASGPMLRLKGDDLATLYAADMAPMEDYVLAARARINSGALVLTVRGDDNLCAGYDLVLDPAVDYVALQETDTECESTEISSVLTSPVAIGEWFEARLAVSGTQITAWINGQQILTASDATLTSGIPFFYFFPPDGGQVLIDLASARIEQLDGEQQAG